MNSIMQAVILAAGKGTRLGDATCQHTKAMLPVVGLPMVERVMVQIAAAGVEDFILVVSPQDTEIVPYFTHRSRFAGRVKFIFQPEPLGMGHALLCAAGSIEGDFLLSSCDSLVSITHICAMLSNWRDYPQANALLSLLPVPQEDTSSSAVVELRSDEISAIIEKPGPDQAFSNIASLPLYIFTHHILDNLEHVEPSPRGEIELQDAIQMLIEQRGGVHGVLANRRLTLTSLADYVYLSMHYLRSPEFISRSYTFHGGVGLKLIPPYFIGAGVTIGDNCTIGPFAFIDSGSTLEPGMMVSHAVVLGEKIFQKGGYCTRLDLEQKYNHVSNSITGA